MARSRRRRTLATFRPARLMVPQAETGTTAETAPDRTPGAQGESAPPQDAPPPDDASLAASQSEGEDADVPDDAATVPFVNRRIKQLNAKRRDLEKQLAGEQQQNALRTAQLEARLDTLTKVLSGAAPEVPASPPQPTGPPQAEQYASHEDYVLAAARYGAQQEFQARDQQTAQQRQQYQQLQFQQDLMSREQTFKEAHPDFDSVVRGGPGGQSLAYPATGADDRAGRPRGGLCAGAQPDLVQRLNTLPPPLVLVELGRLSPSATPPVSPAVGSTNGNGSGASRAPARADGACGWGREYRATHLQRRTCLRLNTSVWRAKTSNIPYLRRS